MQIKNWTHYYQLICFTDREDVKNLFRFELTEDEFKNDENNFRLLSKIARSLNCIIYDHLGHVEDGYSLRRTDQKYLNLNDSEADFIDELKWQKPDVDKKGAYVRKIIERFKQSGLFTDVIDKIVRKFNSKSHFKSSLEKGFFKPDFLIEGRNLEEHFHESEDRDRKIDVIYKTYCQIFKGGGVEKINILKHQVFALYILVNKLDEILLGQLGDIQSLVEYFEKDLNEIEENSIEVINKLTDRDWGSKDDQYIDLAGRVEDLVLSLKASKVVTIVGEGGLGKTELVYQSLKKIVNDTNYDMTFSRVYPFTFKGDLQQEFCERIGRKSVNHNGWIPQSEFTQVLTFLAEKSGLWKDKTNVEQRLDSAIKHLVEGSYCIVIDNTEIIEEGEFQQDLEGFIDSFLNNCRNDTKSRIIITTRVKNEQRKGQQINMKFLNNDEMKLLAIARANWLYKKRRDHTPQINISNNYSGWDNFSELISSTLGKKNAHVIGHPLFVFVGVYASMFDNPKKLPFHSIIKNLVEGINDSDNSNLVNLFSYITKMSINYIKELELWAPVLFKMVNEEIFTIDEIMEWAHEENSEINAIEIVNRLEALQIIKPSSDNNITTYEFKTEYHRGNLRTKILQKSNFKEQEKVNQSKLNEFKVLLERISQTSMYAKNEKYITLQSRIDYLKNKKIKTLNKEWIDIIKGLLNRSIEGVEKLKPGGEFIKNNELRLRLSKALQQYVEVLLHKIIDYFSDKSSKEILLYLSEIQTRLKEINYNGYKKKIEIIIASCIEKLDFLYNKDTLIAAEHLFYSIQSTEISISVHLELKLYNIMVGSHGQEIDRTILMRFLNISKIDDKRSDIRMYSDKLCRALSKAPSVLNQNGNAIYPLFSILEEEKEFRFADRFDSFIIECPGVEAKDNVSNFIHEQNRILIHNSPNKIRQGFVKLLVIWIGQGSESEANIYYTTFIDDNVSKSKGKITKGNPETFSKNAMVDLMDGCFKSRIKVTQLLENVMQEMNDKNLNFTWKEWKKHWFSNSVKLRDLLKELGGKDWIVKGSDDQVYLEKREVSLASVQAIIDSPKITAKASKEKRKKKSSKKAVSKASELSRRSRKR